MNIPEIGQKFRHVKRGSVYEVIAIGTFQCSYEGLDDQRVVVYKEANNFVWVRPVTEFCDGRFEAVP